MAEETRTIGANTTIEDYLYGCVNFPVPSEAINTALLKQNKRSEGTIVQSTLYASMEEKDIDLCEAELYLWICTSPSRLGSVTDKDNDWEHADGGITLSDTDRKYYRSLANDIYKRYGLTPVGQPIAKILNFGVKHCNYDGDLNPIR